MRAAAVRVALCVCFLTAVGTAGPATGNVRVLIRTGVGDITVEIDVRHAPITAANFLAYVDQGLLDGASFYRVVRLDNQPDRIVLYYLLCLRPVLGEGHDKRRPPGHLNPAYLHIPHTTFTIIRILNVTLFVSIVYIEAYSLWRKTVYMLPWHG